VERAGAWPADALLIAGDLFEHDRVSRDTISFIISTLRTIPEVRVFIAPGNHDPFVPDSPYSTEVWPNNVTIFSKPEWQSVRIKDGALTVHGFGFDGPDISSNPFGALAIPESERGAAHVAVAHGSERGHQPPDKQAYASFDGARAATEGLDYLALGHFHGVTQVEGTFSTEMWYSGAPEGQSLREDGMHYFLEVEIENGAVRVTKAPSSRVIYTTHRLTCDQFESAQNLIDAIRRIAQNEELRQVARIILEGNIEAALHAELGLVYDSVSLEFEHLYLVDRTAPLEDFEELAREETSLGAFVRRMNDEYAGAQDEGQRQRIARARDVGVAAFRGREIEIRGLERA
jgi:DNA repair exonuclease SbcCD nuclease subunit